MDLLEASTGFQIHNRSMLQIANYTSLKKNDADSIFLGFIISTGLHINSSSKLQIRNSVSLKGTMLILFPHVL